LPDWATDGGVAALADRIRNPQSRKRLVADIERICIGRDWDDDLIVKVTGPHAASLVGRTIGGIARESDTTPANAVVELLAADAQFWVAPTIKRQRDLDTLLRHERCVPVTDGMAAHPTTHAPLGLMPKTFGTFPLLLGDYVRDRGVLALADAIARATSIPAGRVGLANRGRLKPGYRADMVVFDPRRVANTATDDHPGSPPVGIRDVMVNGSWALRNGRLTRERNGEVLT
jgi:N-acyl-D-amino-acid deacylase